MESVKVAKMVLEKINNEKEMHLLFTEENLSEVFVYYKTDEKKKACRLQRDYNFGFTGKMDYYAVDPKDEFLENVCEIDPGKINGIYEIGIYVGGLWFHYRIKKEKLYFLSDAWREIWTLVK